MIRILIGNDEYAIETEIKAIKAKIKPQWRAFNYHRFDSSQLEEAVACSLTHVFADGQKLVVVTDCDFRQFGETGLSILQAIAKLPPSTTLVFTAASIDRRLKVSKFLLQYAKLQEFNLIPPWRNDLIRAQVAARARELNLRLNSKVLNYLAEAMGNDSFRTEQELQKLAVYAGDRAITQAEVAALIPNRTQTNLQLASALRQGKAKQVVKLVNELLAQAEYPLVMIATLITQFRTWLWVKVAMSQGVKSDLEIALWCGVGNPKRMSFLKNEVKEVEERSLVDALTQLLDLEVKLKQGVNTSLILPNLLRIVRLIRNLG